MDSSVAFIGKFLISLEWASEMIEPRQIVGKHECCTFSFHVTEMKNNYHDDDRRRHNNNHRTSTKNRTATCKFDRAEKEKVAGK